MARGHFTRLTFGRAAATALVLAVASTTAPGEEAGSAPLAFNTARVSIAGTSNIHAFTASTSTVRLTRVQLAADAAGPGFWATLLTPGAVAAFEVAIPAASLSSPKEGLDKNMHKALKVNTFPEITFRLSRIEPAAHDAIKAIGTVGIAGVESEVALDLKTERRGAGLAVTGELALLMTDYGIKPPTAMLGMLKTDPKVTVTFEVVLAVPTT